VVSRLNTVIAAICSLVPSPVLIHHSIPFHIYSPALNQKTRVEIKEDPPPAL